MCIQNSRPFSTVERLVWKGIVFFLSLLITSTKYVIHSNYKHYPTPLPEGWFVVVSRSDSFEPDCEYEKWWQKKIISSRGLSVDYQPPYIIYGSTAKAQKGILYGDGGKIQISVV